MSFKILSLSSLYWSVLKIEILKTYGVTNVTLKLLNLINHQYYKLYNQQIIIEKNISRWFYE